MKYINLKKNSENSRRFIILTTKNWKLKEFQKSYTQNRGCFENLEDEKFSTSLVLIAWFRAGLAGLNLGYPENPALKPRKPS